MAARAMANFGLTEMRLVAPRDGWPKTRRRPPPPPARRTSSTPPRSIPTRRAAIADLTLVYATTARERGQMKRVRAFPPRRCRRCARRSPPAGASASCSGASARGCWNDEIALAGRDPHLPGEPGLPLAQPRPGGAARRLRVVSRRKSAGALPFGDVERPAGAARDGGLVLSRRSRPSSMRPASTRPTRRRRWRATCATCSCARASPSRRCAPFRGVMTGPHEDAPRRRDARRR